MFKKIILRTLLGLFSVFALFVGLVVIPYFANIVMPWDRSDAVEAAITWGGLANIPRTADIVSVDTEGNMFTRTFIVEFILDSKEIDNWVKRSKRLNNATFKNDNNGVITYEIYPGEEHAIGGTVIIDKCENRVIIDMSWS